MAGKNAPTEGKISPYISRALGEYLLLPTFNEEGVTLDEVNLGATIRYGDGKEMRMPLGWFSAAMQCVSGYKLGVALAQQGGCAVLPRSLSLERRVEDGERIKGETSGIVYGIHVVNAEDTVGDVLARFRETGHSIYPVLNRKGELAGLVTRKNYVGANPRTRIRDLMIDRRNLTVARENISPEKMRKRLLKQGIGILPIVDNSGKKLVGAMFWDDVRLQRKYPDAFVDEKGRYRYAAAISTREGDIEEAKALVAANCDILNIDRAASDDIHTVRMIERLREAGIEVPLMVGNVVDGESFRRIAEAGADIVKIGQGPGYGCSTRIVKHAGRGQATAIQQVALARDRYADSEGRYILLCADGGMSGTGPMLVAYALGADMLMMGEYFGRFTESAAPLVDLRTTVPIGDQEVPGVVTAKEYWGEASPRARALGRYGHETDATFTVEGVERLIGHVGPLEDHLPRDLTTLRDAIAARGARNIREFYEKSRLELQSPGSSSEGRPQS